MAKDIPADEASEQVASCAAAMGIAVGAGAENSIRCSGPEPEIDGGDDDSSPVPGRSFDQDVRIAIHEAGHESRRLNFVGALTGGSESCGCQFSARMSSQGCRIAFTPCARSAGVISDSYDRMARRMYPA
ncbi:MAG TPA: hypothetical protein VE567_08590 [Sphingomonas sp.]|nr:hypothetical protein [Sphingomonas sp.]